MARAPDGEVERCASIDGRLGPDAPAMALDDSLHDGEADTGAFEVLGAMHSLKYAEQLAGVLGIEADAFSAAGNPAFSCFFARADIDMSLVPAAGVFEGGGG